DHPASSRGGVDVPQDATPHRGCELVHRRGELLPHVLSDKRPKPLDRRGSQSDGLHVCAHAMTTRPGAEQPVGTGRPRSVISVWRAISQERPAMSEAWPKGWTATWTSSGRDRSGSCARSVS